MLGDIVRMEAVNAGQNIGAGYIDQDNFYPADGVDNDDLDTIDMVYDNSANDLSPSADFFDGDYQNSYADGDEDDDDYDALDDDDDYDDFDDDDYEDFDDDEDYDYAEEDYDPDDDEYYDEEDDFESLNGYGNPYDSEAEWEDFDGEGDLDMEESTGDYNDLSSGGFDFFEGGDPELDIDYNNFDSDTYSEARGRRKKKSSGGGVGSTLKKAVDSRFGEAGQERREKRRDSREKRREDRRADRTEKRDDRKEARKDRREERQGLRTKKKLSKIGETEARSEATRALATPQAEISLAPLTTDLTKRADVPKKGLGTGAIVGISLGALAVVGTALFFILKKK